MPMMANRSPSGRRLARPGGPQRGASVASVTSASAVPTAVDVERLRPGRASPARPSRSAQAIRNSSRRRSAADRAGSPRPGRRAGPAGRDEAVAQHVRAGAARSSASSASSRSASGSRASRSVDVPGQAEQPGQPQRHRALVAQQPQVPRACCRACRRPAGRRAGRGPARARRRTRCSSTGSSVRWIAAVRRHPAGERLAGAAARRPGRRSRGSPAGCRAASGVSRSASAGTRATASSSGR